MTVLHAVLLAAALVVLAASTLFSQPAEFAFTGAGSLVLFVVGGGALAAAAIPWRGRRALAALAALAVAVLVAVRVGDPRLLAAACALAQGIGLRAP
jgi:hypothetical protein